MPNSLINTVTSDALFAKYASESENFITGLCSAVSSASESRARGPGFDTRSGDIFSLLLPLTQEGQLSDTGESRCTL